MGLGIKAFTGLSLEAYRAPVQRLNVWDGSVRSGKTINSLIKYVKWVRESAPPGLLMITAKTERTARQNVVDPLMDIFGPGIIKYSAGNHELWICGRRHIIVGASDARAESKIRGTTLAGSYVDEITLVPESFWTMLLSRLSLPGSAAFGTTNPDSPVHWLKRRFLDKESELDLRRWHFLLDDNPHLADEFVTQLKREYRGLWYKRYIEGLWALAEGSIYDTLDEDIHLVDELPRTDWTFAGVDAGTTNPTVFFALSYIGNSLIFHHEYRHDSQEAGRQKTITEYSRDFRQWRTSLPQEPSRVYIDPSANSLILQLWRDGERGIHPADNRVMDGIQNIAALFGTGALKFHRPTMGKAWEEFASYAWDPDASERGEDIPLKIQDHAPDAGRYALMGSRGRWRHLLKGPHAVTAS